MKTKLTTRGQVSIPAEIRKKFSIDDGTEIEWVAEGNVIKAIPLPKDPISYFKGRGKGRFSTSDLLKERNAERKREDRRK
jgi:AbrB family looped-hinge helix DNA binding protein